jgi:hypothetical protein
MPEPNRENLQSTAAFLRSVMPKIAARTTDEARWLLVGKINQRHAGIF